MYSLQDSESYKGERNNNQDEILWKRKIAVPVLLT